MPGIVVSAFDVLALILSMHSWFSYHPCGTDEETEGKITSLTMGGSGKNRALELWRQDLALKHFAIWLSIPNKSGVSLPPMIIGMTADGAGLLGSDFTRVLMSKFPSLRIKSYIPSKTFILKVKTCKEGRTTTWYPTEGSRTLKPSRGWQETQCMGVWGLGLVSTPSSTTCWL